SDSSRICIWSRGPFTYFLCHLAGKTARRLPAYPGISSQAGLMSIKGFFAGIIKYTLLIISLMVVGAVSTFVTLQLFTSSGQVTVPDLTGKDPVEAIQALNKEGLSLKILPQKRYDDKIPAEKIVAQNPLGGTRIKQGRSIEVYISLG